MPTTRRRHVITETDDVARALDDAARRWPTESRKRLLMLLLREGHRALVRDHRQIERRRLDAVERTSGALTGAYEPGYLSRLRDEWPG